MSTPLDNYDDFVEKRWFSAVDSEEHDRSVIIATLGLNGEAGEVAEKIKKFMRGDDVTAKQLRINVGYELGDVLFYLTKLAHLFSMTLHEIAELNVEKLTSRTRRGTTRGDGDDR